MNRPKTDEQKHGNSEAADILYSAIIISDMNRTSPEEQKQGHSETPAKTEFLQADEGSSKKRPREENHDESLESQANRRHVTWDEKNLKESKSPGVVRESENESSKRQKMIELENHVLRSQLEEALLENRQLRRMMEEEQRVAFSRNRVLQELLRQHFASHKTQEQRSEVMMRTIPKLVRPARKASLSPSSYESLHPLRSTFESIQGSSSRHHLQDALRNLRGDTSPRAASSPSPQPSFFSHSPMQSDQRSMSATKNRNRIPVEIQKHYLQLQLKALQGNLKALQREHDLEHQDP